MPGVTYATVAYPAFNYLKRARRPTVLVPDSEDSGGYNDRMAFMNRAAADVYFGQHQYLQSQLHGNANEGTAFGDFNTSEELLHRVITRGSVRLLRIPTLSALRCCIGNRSYCWNSKCAAYCVPAPRDEMRDASKRGTREGENDRAKTRSTGGATGRAVGVAGDKRTAQRVMWLKYQSEALIATHHARLLQLGLARIVSSARRCNELNASLEASAFHSRRLSPAKALRPDQRPPFDYAYCLEYSDREVLFEIQEKKSARRSLECSPCEAAHSLETSADAAGLRNGWTLARWDAQRRSASYWRAGEPSKRSHGSRHDSGLVPRPLNPEMKWLHEHGSLLPRPQPINSAIKRLVGACEQEKYEAIRLRWSLCRRGEVKHCPLGTARGTEHDDRSTSARVVNASSTAGNVSAASAHSDLTPSPLEYHDQLLGSGLGQLGRRSHTRDNPRRQHDRQGCPAGITPHRSPSRVGGLARAWRRVTPCAEGAQSPLPVVRQSLAASHSAACERAS